MTKATVFLSYSHMDGDIVERVAEELRAWDLVPWLDRERLEPGESFVQAIGTGVAEAAYVLLFWSVNAARSSWVRVELDASFLRRIDDRSLSLVPILLDGTELPELLKPITGIEFEGQLEVGLTKLRKFFGSEGFGPDQPPRLLGPIPNCPKRLSAMRNKELRLLLKARCSLNDVREFWMDTFDTRLDDELPSMPIGLAVGEMLLRAEQRRLRDALLESICANRPDVGRG